MASIISASTTAGTALNFTADTSGILILKTGATPTTAMTIDGSQNVSFAGTPTFTGALGVASGGTGATTLTGYVKGSGTSIMTASSTIPASDLTGTIAAARLPAGSVLQVVSVTKSDTFTTTSSSYTDITGLSVSITPSSATNKILVFVQINWQPTGGSSAFVSLVRGATLIDIGDAASTRTQSTFQQYFSYTNDNSQVQSSTGVYLDSPATTSATTYKMQGLTRANTLYVNRSATDTDSNTFARTASTITVMEIAA